MTAPQPLVQKLWKTCNILRDDARSYGRRLVAVLPPRVGRLRSSILQRAFEGKQA